VATTTFDPDTVTFTEGSAVGAGPPCTLPSAMENVLPWQGHTMTPFWTPATVQPWCVQTAENALNSPAFGWVTTTGADCRTTPPPTGTELAATTVPDGVGEAVAVAEAGVGPIAGAVVEVEADAEPDAAADDPSEGDDEQAEVTAAAATTAPPVSSTRRRGSVRAGSGVVMRPPGL
jgi:hypothetical protein